MYTQAEIATNALLDLGAQEVTDINNETSKEASLVRNCWAIVRDEVMAAHPWDFAKKWKALAEDDSFTMIDEKWDFVYALPADYLKMVEEENERTAYTNYEIRENRFYCNVDTVKIEYIARIDDVSKWPIWFTNAVIARLRARFAIPLSKKGSKTIDWYQIYLIELGNAKLTDSQQSKKSETDKGMHTSENDSWLNAGKI